MRTIGISSSATRCHTSAIRTARQRQVLRQHVLLSSGQGWSVVASTRQFSWTTQRLASVPEPPKKVPHSESVPPPPLAQPRKQKVELKPGPVKPKASEPGPSSTSLANQQEAVVKAEKTSSPSTSPISHTDTSGGVIETAKHDYADASQHGILAPAPEGSSRIYTLFHQAKELFVRVSNQWTLFGL